MKSEGLHFRPGLGATVIALPAFVALLGLGTWQLARFQWKTELIAFRESQLAAPATPLQADILYAGDALAALEYRRVTVTGVFLHDREIYLAATRRGKVGFQVITPLRRDSGPSVLVNRGWVPTEARDPARRPDSQREGVVAVEGVVRGSSRRGWFTPDNDPAKNYWFWLDLPAMAAFAGIDAPPVIVVAGPAADPGSLPIGKEMRVNLRNDHLQYAIIWYSLAVALAVIFVLSQRSRPSAGG